MQTRDILKGLMQKHRLLPSKLAEQSGLNLIILHRILTGETNDPKLSSLIKLSNALGLTVSQLIGQDPLPN